MDGTFSYIQGLGERLSADPVSTECDCEHTSHFPGEDSPNTSNHRYGESATPTEPVKTQHGTFHICLACRQAHPISAEYLL